MIPVTYPSSVSTSKESQMVVFALPSVTGLQRWTDYIPVKFQATGTANSFNTDGYLACDFLPSSSGRQAWVDYIPVFVDVSATDAWQVSANGFIPFNTLAGGGLGSSLDFNFVATGTLDPLITFTRASTGTFFNSAGVLTSAAINAPRFDYNPATLAARGLLIEEQRTNSVLYSQNQTIERRVTLTGISGTFLVGQTVTATGGGTGTIYAVIGAIVEVTLAAGTFTGTLTSSGGATGTIALTVVSYFYGFSGAGVIPVATKNYAVAPDGTITATRIIFDKGAGTTVGDSSYIATQGYNTTTGQPQAASVWLKSNTGSTYTVRFDFNGSAADAGGTSSTLTVTPTWQRFTIALASASDTLRTSVLRLRGTLGTSDYADILVWGWQQEVDRAFSTSYIPTTTTALTRSADVASVNTLSPWFNSASGTIYFEGTTFSTLSAAFPFAYVFSNGTTNNRIQSTRNNSNGAARFAVVDGGATQAAADATAWTLNATTKSALGYAVNDFAFVANGGAVTTDTSGTVPAVSDLLLGATVGGVSQLNGYLRRITYYPRRLSDAELQAITA